MSNTPVSILSTITAMLPNLNLKDCYLLFYRDRANPQNMKGFSCEGGLREAIKRAQLHCTRMGYRFVYVRELIEDFEKAENHQNPGVMNTMTSDKELPDLAST